MIAAAVLHSASLPKLLWSQGNNLQYVEAGIAVLQLLVSRSPRRQYAPCSRNRSHRSSQYHILASRSTHLFGYGSCRLQWYQLVLHLTDHRKTSSQLSAYPTPVLWTRSKQVLLSITFSCRRHGKESDSVQAPMSIKWIGRQRRRESAQTFN